MFHRLWFYDISAGPMGRTGGFDLMANVPRFLTYAIDAGAPDYRFHHTADYGTPSGTYRPINTMVDDAALLVGGVFVSEIAFAGPLFPQFNVPPALAASFAGIAVSNYGGLTAWTPTFLPDTRQSFVFTSTTPLSNAIVGHGDLIEHETGHHLGFSHPFQGYVCITETCGFGGFVQFGGTPDTWFSMSGNYVTGVMTYAQVNNDYSRFELDHLQRWLTWQYLDLSNFIVSQIAGSPRAGSVAAMVSDADTHAGAALAAYQRYDYEIAVEQSRASYDALVVAANTIDVNLAPEAYQAVRRNPADFNQALRDFLASILGDSVGAMSGTISAAGVRGLEGITLLPASTPLAVPVR